MPRRTYVRKGRDVLLVEGAALHARRLAASGKADATLRHYQLVHRTFIAFVSELLGRPPTLADLTMAHAEEWQIALRERGLSGRTRGLYSVALRCWAQWLAEESLPEVFSKGNPLAKLAIPKPERTKPHTLRVDQIRLLLAGCQELQYPRRARVLVLLLWDTGLRIEELCNLKVHEIDGATRDRKGDVHVIRGKGAKERFSHLGEVASRTLEEYIEIERRRLVQPIPDSPWLFVTRTGRRLCPDQARDVLREAAARAGLPPRVIHPHAFRHTFGRGQAAANVNAFAIQDLMGHETAEMTKHYVQLSQQELGNSYVSLVDRALKRNGVDR